MIAKGNVGESNGRGGSAIFWVLVSLGTCFGTGCSEPERPVVALSSRAIAQIGSQTVSSQSVQKVVAARKIPAAEALRLIESDALAAEYFTAKFPKRTAVLERVALAKQLLVLMHRKAVAVGQPTDAEVAGLSEARWWERIRPRMVQVVHAVVMSKDESEQARNLALKLASAVGKSTTSADFAATIRGIDKGDWDVKVEALAPVGADGRTVDPDNPPPVGPRVTHLVKSFVTAAHALKTVGEVSPVIRSEFGYHVMVMHRQWVAQNYSSDQTRKHYSAEIYDNRTREAQDKLLERLRQESKPSIDRAAMSRMAAFAKE